MNNLNLNNIYNLSYKDAININICNRAKLDTGTHCNYGCSFCYYIDKLNIIKPFELIKKDIDYFKACEITELDLSGGESSIHKDWFKILEYARGMGFSVSCLSNGSKFSDIPYPDGLLWDC